MFFLVLFSTIPYHCRLVVFLLTSVGFSLSSGITNYKYVNSVGAIMPVTTRSKSRLLQGHCNELQQVCLECSPGLAATSISSSSSMTKYMSEPSNNFLENASLPSLFDSSSSSSMFSLAIIGDSISTSQQDNLKLVDSSSQTSTSNSSVFLVPPVHNFSSNQFSMMEADCQDIKMKAKPDPAPPDAMQQLFTSLMDHISVQTTRIQEQLQLTNMQLTEAQEDFKSEVQNELDAFRAFLANAQASQDLPSPPNMSSVPVVPVVSSRPPVIHTLPTVVSNSGGDIQTQMMLMLTESFSKLSTVLTDQKPDSKVEWHKFSGDSKKFRAWYLGIMAHLALPPWTDLYDPISNNVVASTSNSLLNGRLYSKVLLALDGTAYQNFVTRKHLRANGIRLLQELVQTYKPKNVPEITAAKTVEFWGNTKRHPSESIDSYYDRFQELCEVLAGLSGSLIRSSGS